MKHAAHKAGRGSQRQFSVSKALFASSRGGHSAKTARMVERSANGGAVVGLDDAVARKLNEIAPRTRRSIRQANRAAERKSVLLASTSLATLVGTAATVMAFASPDESATSLSEASTTTTQLKRVSVDSGSTVSRSEERTALTSTDGTVSTAESTQTANDGGWQLGAADTSLDVNQMSRSTANNQVVASLMDGDASVLPAGFNPNHATGDVGNVYEFSQCTWWVYTRRTQLGLPVGSHMGNGNMWANSARALGYWVDNTPRHVGDIIVFAAGQADSDATYGHVAIVEKINEDGSIVTSECGSVMNGQTYSRTFTAAEAGNFEYIHY